MYEMHVRQTLTLYLHPSSEQDSLFTCECREQVALVVDHEHHFLGSVLFCHVALVITFGLGESEDLRQVVRELLDLRKQGHIYVVSAASLLVGNVKCLEHLG